MAKKKVVLFIVEGVNDKTCLEGVLRRIISSNEVAFQITYGDVTTDLGMDKDKIRNKIGTIVKEYKDKYRLAPGHFMQVVHIIDMDGAFISDSMIKKANVEDPLYLDSGIETNNVDYIVNRNRNKREIVERMLTLKTVLKTVPYSVYYFSSNMDHVLHNNANMSREEKDHAADAFDEQYSEDTDGFLKLLCASDFSVKGDYKSSWQFIQTNNRSICRYSNFSVFLDLYR